MRKHAAPVFNKGKVKSHTLVFSKYVKADVFAFTYTVK